MMLNQEFVCAARGPIVARRRRAALAAIKSGEDGRRQPAEKARRQAGVIVEHDAMQARGRERRYRPRPSIHLRLS
jgi:hypothetical protein